MIVGFINHDDGKSFDKGLDILDEEFMLSQIISPFSMKTIYKIKDTFIIKRKYYDTYNILRDWFINRAINMFGHFSVIPFM